MALKLLSLVRLACIAAFSFAPICSASPKGRPIRRPPLTQSIHAREESNISFPITQALPPNPSSVVLEDSPTSTCQTYGCNLFYQSVLIYYWPTESQNTACLASLGSPLASPTPPELEMVSPSIYAIFPSIMASDGCKQIGKGYGPITATFAPGELSTIDLGAKSTNVYNFADLPCPPSGIDVPPGQTYAPLIAPPRFFWDLDPAFSGCVPGYSQGVDPPFAVHTTKGPDGPEAGAPFPRPRDLGAHTHPRATFSGPVKTPAPTQKV